MEKTKKKMSKKKVALLVIVLLLVVLLGGSYIYISDYYHAMDEAKEALGGSDEVKVTEIADGYFFDGAGENSAMIFYPGGKVEYTSYAPLMEKISAGGVDCFLLEMPANLAVFGGDMAADIMEDYDYDHWIMAGHSLGGVMAASFAADHSDSIDGLVLLASYSTEDLSETDLEVLSIVGSNDGVLNQEKATENATNLPEGYTDVVIAGGNHANYGSYGAQDGDGEASISRAKQQQVVADDVIETFADLL